MSLKMVAALSFLVTFLIGGAISGCLALMDERRMSQSDAVRNAPQR